MPWDAPIMVYGVRIGKVGLQRKSSCKKSDKTMNGLLAEQKRSNASVL